MNKKKNTPTSSGRAQSPLPKGKKVRGQAAKKPAHGFASFKEKAREAQAPAQPKATLAKRSEVNRRESSSGIVLTAALIVAVLAVNVLIFAIVSVTGAYFPLVKEKDLTLLSDATNTLFDDAKAANKKVKITFFYSFSIETDVKNHSTGSWVHRSVQNFKEKHPDFIEVDYVNLVTRESYLEAQKGESGNARVSLEKYQNTATPLTRYSVAFECGNNVRVVTDLVSQSAYGDFFTLDESLNPTSYDGEQYIAGMICNVTRDEPLKAYIVKGHSETIDPAFGRVLTLSGYEYDGEGFDIGKASGEEWNELKKECDLLIISNPKNDFSSVAITSEIERLKDYVRSGGNLMVMLDPLAKKKLTTLEGFLEDYGISVSRSTLDDGREVCDVIREDGVLGAGGAAVGSTDGYTFAASFATEGIGGTVGATVKNYTGANVVVSTAGALNLSGNAQPLLLSSKTSHCEVDGVTTKEGGSYVIAAVSKNPAELGNSGESTIFVMSGIYSTSSTFLTANGFANRDFYYSVIENAFGADHLPYGMKMALISDIPIIEGLTMGTAKLYLALAMLPPVALAIAGTVIVIRRKHR